MQLSTRGRYAVMAMVELAGRSCPDLIASNPGVPCRPVTLHELAASQQLSLCYLEQLFGGLRRAGLVLSARGPSGGYKLARPASTISVAEVLGAAGEQLHATRCTPGSEGCMQGEDGHPCQCRTHALWAELGEQIGLFLGGVTLADVLADRIGGRALPPRPAGAPAAIPPRERASA